MYHHPGPQWPWMVGAACGGKAQDSLPSCTLWGGLLTVLTDSLPRLLLFQLGFFKRAQFKEAKVPQYHAVKIPRQERQLFREEKTGTITKKDWVTNWSGESDGHVPASA